MNRFYAIIPIGLEDLALKELSKVSLDLQLEFGEQGLLQDIQMEMGGIEFDFDFHLGILLNTILKIPSRLLLRWHKFEAKEFPTLFKKLNNLPWESSVFKDGIGEIEVAASKSKLNNEKRILKVLKEEVLVQKKIAIGIKNAPNLYLRMYNDQLQLSIDTTGEHLHFRGYRNTQGVAPLRENFAASLWYFTTQDLGLIDLKNLKIVDPLCGSGTLLFESFLFEKILNFQRDFPLLKLVPQKIFDRFKTALSSSQGVSHFNSFFGFDSLENIVQVAKTNLSLITEKYPEGKNISFVQQDLFSKDKAPLKSDIVLSNPPYGERLKLKDGYSLPNYIEAILTEYEPQIAGFVLPAKSEILNLNQILNYKKENQIQFLNNGIRVVMQKYVRSKS